MKKRVIFHLPNRMQISIPEIDVRTDEVMKGLEKINIKVPSILDNFKIDGITLPNGRKITKKGKLEGL